MNIKEAHREWSKRMAMDQTAVKDPYDITTTYEPEEIRLEKLTYAVKEVEAIVRHEVTGKE